MGYPLEDFQELGNTKPIHKAFKYGLISKASEVCGIFVFDKSFCDYNFIGLKNLNLTDPHSFNVNNKEFYKYYFDNRIISLFHTHIIDSSDLSDIDKSISNSLNLPSYVFSIKSKSSCLYYPKSFIPRPLKNRVFIPFFQDCVSYVKDFYLLNFKINLSDHIFNWARSLNGSNDRLLNEIENLFFEVNINERKYGDLIVFYPDISPYYHLGVIEENQNYSHHPIISMPSTQLFTNSLVNKVYKIYRYKEQ